MSGEDAPRPYLENLIVLEINTNKQAITWIARSTAHYRYTPEATRRALLKKMCINTKYTCTHLFRVDSHTTESVLHSTEKDKYLRTGGQMRPFT
jgi:hypothetical protein